MKKILAAVLALVALQASAATVWQVAPVNKTTVRRTTQPDAGTANVGDPCEAQAMSILTTAAGKRTEWHALKGSAPPSLRLAPCVAVTVVDPVPPVVLPPPVVI